MKIHELKTDPEYFKEQLAGNKNFEVRRNDRIFEVGDILILKEYENNKYTGETHSVMITYILNNREYCKENYVVLGTKPVYIGIDLSR